MWGFLHIKELYNTIQVSHKSINSDTFYQKESQISQVKGSVPQDFPLPLTSESKTSPEYYQRI